MTKLLVVDQHRSARRGLKDDLTKRGYEVQEATTTETGLEMALKGGYAGILLDVQMAIKDDWNVLHMLKENRQTKGTPVMMLTAVRSDKNEAIGLRLGAPHFIPKPWHPDGLALTVRVALREAEERARLEIAEEHLDDVYSEEQAPAASRKSNKSPYDTGEKVVKLDKLLAGGIAIETLRNYLKTAAATVGGTTGVHKLIGAGLGNQIPSCRSAPISLDTWTAMRASVLPPTAGLGYFSCLNCPASPRLCGECGADIRGQRQRRDRLGYHTLLSRHRF